MIPDKLQQPFFRFIKVRENKAPLEERWTDKNNYMYNETEIIAFIEKEKRYGIVTGFGGLLVIDFDTETIQKEVMQKLPETFTVKTAGRGLYHLYFIVDAPESFKVLDINKNTLADIQGTGKQVIGPGTELPNGKRYEIVKDIPLVKMKMTEIKFAFSGWLNIEKDIKKKEGTETDNDCKKIKEQVKVIDLLKEYGVDTTKNPTSCPLHTSKGGKCFSFTEEVWHCFHCEQKGNIFHLVMAHDNCSFVEAKQLLANRVGLKLSKGLISGLKIDNYTENVEAFYQEKPFFYDKNCLFWFWNEAGGRYEMVDDIDLMNSFDDLSGFDGKTVNSKLKAQYIEAFKRVGRKHKPLDAPKNLVQFKNKVFDLKNKTLTDTTPEFFFTNPIPWDIGESSDTPTMDRIITEWVGKENLKFAYEILAYCCYADYPIHRIFCFIGIGRNGKSKFQGLISKFIGRDNNCSTELDLLSNSRFESFKLYKKLVCSMGETNFGVINNTSILKRLTGQDPIGFEYKNKAPFDDFNYAKIIIASNALPITGDTSDGWWRRWIILDFPNTFEEGKDILDIIPDQEFGNLAKKTIEILPNLLLSGKFTNQGTIEERKQKYILSSNPLSLFIRDFCQTGPFCFVSYNKLYVAYIHYLNSIKKRKVKSREFKAALEDEGFAVEKTTKKVNEEFVNGLWVESLQLKDEKYCADYANYAQFSTPTPTHEELSGNFSITSIKSTKPKSYQEIHQKCDWCGISPSYTFASNGKPICEWCYKEKEGKDEQI